MPAFLAPLLVAGLGSLGITVTVATATTIASGLLLGAAVAASFLFKPKLPEPHAAKSYVQSSTPFRRYAYGRPLPIAGTLVLNERLNGYTYVAMALCDHRIERLIQYHANNRPLEVDANGDVVTQPDGAYVGHLNIQSRLGLPAETAYADLVTHIPTMWTNDHTGDGVASTMAIARTGKVDFFSENWPEGLPPQLRIQTEIEAARVWDPRDPEQDPEDETSWLFSTNPALIYIHFKCFRRVRDRRDWREAILPVLGAWQRAAGVCDEEVALKAGGTQKRYEIGGYWESNVEPKAIEKAILDGFDARVVQRGDGALVPIPGKYVEPDIVLTDDDIAGYVLGDDLGSEDAVNELTVTFSSPAHQWADVDTTPFRDEAARDALGKGLPATVTLDWVQDYRRARRIGKRVWSRLRAEGQGSSITLRMTAANVLTRGWARVRSAADPALADAIIMFQGDADWSFNDGLCFTIAFILCGAEIDDFDKDTDEGLAPVVPPVEEDAGPPRPSGVDLVAEDWNGSVQIAVSWDDPEDDGLGYRIRWRIADTGGGDPGPWNTISATDATIDAGRVSATIPAVPPNLDIEVEVASHRGNHQSAWSIAETVSTDVSGLAPSPPSAFTVTPNTGAGTVTAKWRNPLSQSFARAKLWRDANPGSFGAAVQVTLPGDTGAAGQLVEFTVAQATGSFDYWVTAENAGGTASSPTGPVTATL